MFSIDFFLVLDTRTRRPVTSASLGTGEKVGHLDSVFFFEPYKVRARYSAMLDCNSNFVSFQKRYIQNRIIERRFVFLVNLICKLSYYY